MSQEHECKVLKVPRSQSLLKIVLLLNRVTGLSRSAEPGPGAVENPTGRDDGAAGVSGRCRFNVGLSSW